MTTAKDLLSLPSLSTWKLIMELVDCSGTVTWARHDFGVLQSVNG